MDSQLKKIEMKMILMARQRPNSKHFQVSLHVDGNMLFSLHRQVVELVPSADTKILVKTEAK